MIKAVIFDMYETLITHYACPLYFSVEMASDMNIPLKSFQTMWRQSEFERSTGKLSLEDILIQIANEHNAYSKEKMDFVISKRMQTKKECFSHLHPALLDTLNKLKEKNIKIGLISNCFSEEAMVIKESILYPYFDACCLSWNEGICKPDKEIFLRCLNRLNLKAEECLYIGDGGSRELETAKELKMKALQACWYMSSVNPSKPKEGFIHLDSPIQILDYIK